MSGLAAAVEQAEALIVDRCHEHAIVAIARDGDPGALAEFGELSTAALARRILADLLDAGWIPPASASTSGRNIT